MKKILKKRKLNKLEGTIFQKKVWKQLMKIPYGETRSYREIAEAIGRPRAYRAVGSACKQNPYPVTIPCHRVISSDGSLGGFSKGLKMKKLLLSKERSSK